MKQDFFFFYIRIYSERTIIIRERKKSQNIEVASKIEELFNLKQSFCMIADQSY